MPLDDLRRRYGWFCRPILFTGTIEAIYAGTERIGDEQVRRAPKTSTGRLIHNLPNSYKEEVREARDQRFSTGRSSSFPSHARWPTSPGSPSWTSHFQRGYRDGIQGQRRTGERVQGRTSIIMLIGFRPFSGPQDYRHAQGHAARDGTHPATAGPARIYYKLINVQYKDQEFSRPAARRSERTAGADD